LEAKGKILTADIGMGVPTDVVSGPLAARRILDDLGVLGG